MPRTLIRRLAPAAGFVLFAVVLWVLHNELRHESYHGILQAFRAVPASRLLLAAALSLLSYLLLTGYDTLGLRYARHALPYRRTAFASFIGYAFSNTVGHALVSGTSVRLRLYSGWGLSTLAITRIIVFGSVTFWLGFLSIAGVVFVADPLPLPPSLHLPFASARPIGVVCLAMCAAFALAVAVRRAPVRVRGLEFPIPEPRLLGLQLVISCVDWAVVGGVLYCLLPSGSGLSFAGFLGLYLLAQAAATLSQVPGGVGVFETVMLLLLAPWVPTVPALGSLLAFRVVYYLLPLAAAAALLGAHELLERREGVRRVLRVFGRWAPAVVPQLLAVTTFVGGVILLFSGATPTVRSRLPWLRELLPLPVVELSHFIGSVAGAALLILAQGIQRRLDAAYLLAVALLSTGVVVSLLKGLDIEEAAVLTVMLLALLPCRRHFYRKTALTNEPFGAPWIVAIVVVLAASVSLGLFSYKHVEYSNELWWRFAFHGDAPRFLRATVGAIGFGLLFATARLLRPAHPAASSVSDDDFAAAREVVARSPQTYANLALLGDKRFLFSPARDAMIMYGVSGRSWVALGDPVGSPAAMPELVWQFGELCDRHDDWPVFYEVGPEHLHLYLDLGLTVLRIGEEARVPLAGFDLEGHGRKWLRHVSRRLGAEGWQFAILEPGDVPGRMPELERISRAWLAGKNTREKGFSLGVFDPSYLARFPLAVVHREGEAVAFANVWLGAEHEEISVDLMRYLPEAPNGLMEYVFVELMLWGREQGYRWFNLGMAPLSGMPNRALAPLWMRLGAFVFRHGENFYNFQGLRQFKDKFSPAWKPRYLACPGGLALPRIAANLAALIGGGLKGVVRK